MIFFLITLGLQLVGFIFDQVITHKLIQRLKSQYSDISTLSHLHLQIDAQEWKQMVNDFVNRTSFERLEATYGFISENGILLSGVFSWILSISNRFCETVIRGYFESSFVLDNIVIWKGVIFLFIVSLFSAICKAPFEAYRVFVIQNANGSLWKWFVAQLKMGFLAVVIGSPLLSLILWLINSGGGEQWTYVWVGAGALSVGIYELYPSVLLPLFFKITLTANVNPDGTDDGYFARDIWNPFFNKLGIDSDKWQVAIVEHEEIVNAFTVERSGVLWIVVYSPLLELSLEEVQAVIAHEVCHYQHRHSQKTIGLQLLSLGAFLFLFSLVAYRPSFYASFGFESVDIGVGLCLFSYLYSPVAAWLSMIGNYASRSWEFQCDLYAQRHHANIREALISMCDLNGGVDSICGTGMWSVYNRGHPSLLERIQWLDKNK